MIDILWDGHISRLVVASSISPPMPFGGYAMPKKCFFPKGSGIFKGNEDYMQQNISLMKKDVL